MKKKALIISTLLLFVVSTGFAQKNDYSNYNGFVNFGDLEKFETGEEVTEVLIEEHLIRMVAKLAAKEEPEVSLVLDGIKLIKVHTFEVSESNSGELFDKVEKIDKTLMDEGWDRIVKTKSKEETTNVYILTNNEENIEGLVVAGFEKGGEATFVNIVGDINLETIGELGGKFDIPSIGGIHKKDNGQNSN
ncbi:MAG: DUF4252 domain-containing protein [Bacteroidota bacterium]